MVGSIDEFEKLRAGGIQGRDDQVCIQQGISYRFEVKERSIGQNGDGNFRKSAYFGYDPSHL
jgi:hypothetical protein